MKVANIKINYYMGSTPEEYNHCLGCGQADLTLCGEDVAGDNDREITIITGKINCPRCIEIISSCKAINQKDITKLKT